MALTKVTGGVVSTTTNLNVGVVTATKFVGGVEITSGNIVATAATFSGNVSVAGTLTYQDVTNVDSIGVGTFQSNVQVGAGISVVGVSTFSGDIDANADIELAGNLAVTGVSTFTGNIDANGALDVDGQTDLDVLNVSDTATFSGDLQIDSDSAQIKLGDDQDLLLYHNGSNGFLKNSTGQQLYRSDTHTFENAAGNAEHFRVLSDGKLLLGATSASNAENFRIHTASSDKAIMKFTNTGTGSAAGDGLEFGLNSDEHAELVLKEDKNILFFTGATTTEKLRIYHTNASGVGIAKFTSPASGDMLNLQNSTGSGQGLIFGVDTSASPGYTYWKNNTSASYDAAFIVGGSERLRITSAGKVGINTNDPASPLHIGQSTDNAVTAGITLKNNPSIGAQRFTLYNEENVGTHYNSNDGGTARAHIFETGGDEKLRITAAGKVGVNTTASLNAGAMTLYSANEGEGTATGQLELKDNAAFGSTPTGGIIFSGHHTTGSQAIFAGIRGFKANTGDGDLDGCLAFDVRKHGAVAYEAMRITEDGIVGIGTIPASGTTLDIDASGGGVLALRRNSVNTSNKITLSHDGTDGTLDSTNDILFRAGSAERFRIEANGEVGIGTNNPSRRLHVKSAGANATQIALIDNDSTNEVFQIGQQSDGDCFVSIRDDSGNTKISFDASGDSFFDGGKVGFGINAPTGTLSVASGTWQSTTPESTGDDIVISGNQSLGMQFLTLASNTSNNNIYFGDTDDVDVGMIRYAHADNSMQFRTNGSERLRIEAGGNIGIGTNNPNQQVHIEAAIPFLRLEDDTASSKRLDLWVESSDGFIGVNQSAQKLHFQTIGTTRLTLDASGNVVVKTNDVALSGSGTLRINSGSTSGALNLDGGATNHGGEINLTGGSNGGRIQFRTGQGSGQQGEKMRLDENGNLGIGTAAPGALLHTWHATSNTCATFESGDAGAGINLRDPSQRSSLEQNGTDMIIDADPDGSFANSKLKLKVDSSTRLTIDSSALVTVSGTFQVNNCQIRDGGFSGSTAWDTGISVNQSNAGAVMFVMACRNWDAGDSTEAAIYLVRLGYDGNQNVDTEYIQGNNHWSITKSGSNTVQIAGSSGNHRATFIWTT